MKLLSVILLSLALICETTVTTIPLVFVALLAIVSFYKNSFVFLYSFVFGILLDMLTFKTIGVSSIFFVIFTFLVLLYQSKLEISTNRFIVLASFLGSFCYLMFMGYSDDILLQAVISSFFGLILFKLLQRVGKVG